jgi:predicted nucleic acid-binding protein
LILLADFYRIVAELHRRGWAKDDLAWSENIQPPVTPDDFALEVIYVICNSGMRFTVATEIYKKVRAELAMQRYEDFRSAGRVFGHKAKAAAIDRIWRQRFDLWAAYMAAADKLAWLQTLPWIGPITKFHLGKNFGLDVVKPDVHLARLAKLHDTTPDALCAALARQTGYRKATIDTLLWRACAVGIVDSNTGTIKETA